MTNTTEVKDTISFIKSSLNDQLLSIAKRSFQLGIKTTLVPKEQGWRNSDSVELDVRLKGRLETLYAMANDFDSLERAEEFLNTYSEKLSEHNAWLFKEEEKKRKEAIERELELAVEAEDALLHLEGLIGISHMQMPKGLI